MIDQGFIDYINQGSKIIVGIAEQLPKQMEKMKDNVSPEEYKKLQEAIKISDIKGKLQEFQDIKKGLDDTLKKFQ